MRSTLYSFALLAVTLALIVTGFEWFCRSHLEIAHQWCRDPELWFELRVLSSNGHDNIEYDTHPTRGWTPKPYVKLNIGDPTVTTTNNRGMRATPDYVYHPEKYTVMVVGDSFTYGAGAGDYETWPKLLQELDDRLHVLNMAAGGYGVDQMYITMRETIDEYKPQLAILAFIGDDLNRALLAYRDMRKPKFILGDKGELLLTNVPIGSREDTHALLIHKYRFPNLITFAILKDRLKWLINGSSSPPADAKAVWTGIFVEAAKCAKDHGADFLLAHLPTAPAINDPHGTDTGTQFIEEFHKNHDVAVLEAQPAFGTAGKKWTEEHYRGPENRFLAHLIYARIQQLPSWQAFLQKK